MKLPKIKYNFKLSANLALITGLMMGILAAVAQGYFEVQPPIGQGVCAITHPSNLVNWLVNNVLITLFKIFTVFFTKYIQQGACNHIFRNSVNLMKS